MFANLGKEYLDGEWIMRQGEIGTTMHIIQKGKVEVLLENPEGEIRLAVLEEGEVFGELAIFTKKPRSASVRSIGSSRVLTIDKRGFIKRIHEDPILVFRMLQKMASKVHSLASQIDRIKVEEHQRELERIAFASILSETREFESETVGKEPDSCPMKGKKRVLITGATGYVGRRLKRTLMKDLSINIRLFVRNRQNVSSRVYGMLEIAEGNAFDVDSLKLALQDIETAYYLIHTNRERENYEERERTAARNFLEAAIEAGVKQIIYLGCLNEWDTKSKHLSSRIEVGEILSSRPEKIQTIIIRAGCIIGSGSIFYEIIRNLVEKLPFMFAFDWLYAKVQPVSIGDVVKYLAATKQLDIEGNAVIDIGDEPMNLIQMMTEMCSVMGLKRWYIPFPFHCLWFSSYLLALVTPVPFSYAREIVLGLRHDVMLKNKRASEFFSFPPESFKKAILEASKEIERRQVVSRWSDCGSSDISSQNHMKDIVAASYMDRRRLPLCGLPPEKVFEAFTSIGGENGWFKYDILWALRGYADKILGGYGLNRGRRDPDHLRTGDSLDFWKVVNIEENKSLLLYAKMMLPGKAWLEFVVDEEEFVQTAYFTPEGFWGSLYWFAMVPFHHFIFNDLSRKILMKARQL